MKKFLEPFTPFLILGFTIAFFIGLLYIIAHVLIGGILIAGALWAFSYIKQLWQSHQTNSSSTPEPKTRRHKHRGIVIEHDEID